MRKTGSNFRIKDSCPHYEKIISQCIIILFYWVKYRFTYRKIQHNYMIIND